MSQANLNSNNASQLGGTIGAAIAGQGTAINNTISGWFGGGTDPSSSASGTPGSGNGMAPNTSLPSTFYSPANVNSNAVGGP